MCCSKEYSLVFKSKRTPNYSCMRAIFRGLHGAGSGLGEALGLRVAAAQHSVPILVKSVGATHARRPSFKRSATTKFSNKLIRFVYLLYY